MISDMCVTSFQIRRSVLYNSVITIRPNACAQFSYYNSAQRMRTIQLLQFGPTHAHNSIKVPSNITTHQLLHVSAPPGPSSGSTQLHRDTQNDQLLQVLCSVHNSLHYIYINYNEMFWQPCYTHKMLKNCLVQLCAA
jgi:hypothetical protein